MNSFCCPDHARLGRSRWEEKLAMKITPNTPTPPQKEEYVSGNMEEVNEEQ